ncbi:MAG: SEC-C metal-binding domain-containing protein [Terriglobia bacterium]
MAREAGVEGPKLRIWAERLAESHGPAVEWMIRAGVPATTVQKMLKDDRYKSMLAGVNGTRRAFLQAILKRAPKDYHAHQLPPVDDAYAERIVGLLQSADEKHLAVLDYLIEIRSPLTRLVEVLGMKEIKHNILNAKQHEREAQIVAQAGREGAVTVSTNMAGRGTDILLGGNPEAMAREEFRKSPEKYREQGINPEPPDRPPEGSPDEIYRAYVEEYSQWREKWNGFISHFKTVTDVEHERVVELGGLHILCTERHEARRIDNQLRGRAGRQGDPGSSRFYLSLQDDLMRIFAKDWVSNFMQRLGMEEGIAIESRMISKRIEAAQKAVEAQNFESRKHLLEYDDVMNKQRETIYGLRRQLLEGQEQKEFVLEACDRMVDWLVSQFCPKAQHADQWNINGLRTEFWGRLGIDLRQFDLKKFDPKTLDQLTNELRRLAREKYEEREQVWGADRMRFHERMIMLQVVDAQWKDHLLTMDHLKEGIGLRGYGQRDPLVEYKRESFDMFESLMDRVEDETLRYLFLMKTPEEQEEMIRQYQRRKRREQAEMQMVGGGVTEKPQQVIRREKIGRNDPCPCGSGKKYKKCHGAPGPPPSPPSSGGRPSPPVTAGASKPGNSAAKS